MANVKKLKIKKPKLPKLNAQVATALLIALVSVSAGFAGGYWGNKSQRGDSGNEQRTVINNESELISQIAKEVGPGVVSVNVERSGISNTFFGPQQFSQRAAGTGVIVSKEGVIVTNRHVVPKGVQRVTVTLSDGTELDDVSVVGRTNDSDPLDVAFLKVNDNKGKTLAPAKIGDSAKVEVGDKVVAIGNALGQFQNTVTSGIISGFGRDLQASSEGGATENLQNLFQTDAAINQGNSGGPLVNMDGEVIGINTAIAGEAQNIGFAIPINDVNGLIKGVLRGGKLLRPYLGVRYVSLNDDYAYQYNLPVKRGAYLAPATGGSPVIAGSPAEKTGLREKDIITKINDTEINERSGLASVLAQYTVGETVKLTVIRDGKEIKLDVTLEAAPES